MSPEITGTIEVRRVWNTEGLDFTLDFEWVGGDVIAVSNELLKCAYSHLLKRDGDALMIGPFNLTIFDLDGTKVFARRN